MSEPKTRTVYRLPPCQSGDVERMESWLGDMARQGLFFIPLVWILSSTLGLLGIQVTQMVADSLTLACAIPIQFYALRTLDQQNRSGL